jgi:hypothetical protein
MQQRCRSTAPPSPGSDSSRQRTSSRSGEVGSEPGVVLLRGQHDDPIGRGVDGIDPPGDRLAVFEVVSVGITGAHAIPRTIVRREDPVPGNGALTAARWAKTAGDDEEAPNRVGAPFACHYVVLSVTGAPHIADAAPAPPPQWLVSRAHGGMGDAEEPPQTLEVGCASGDLVITVG